MEIRNLETFVKVTELRSFTRAAEQLGFTQSTVSFQIKQLETELGARLFERISHNVTLTNEGEKLLPIALEMIRLSSEAENIARADSKPEGVVRVAIAESLAYWHLTESFGRFNECYPGIRLKISSGSTEDMFRVLAENQADIVYTIDRPILDSRYKVAFEAPVNMLFAVAPFHPLAGKEVTVEGLIEYPLLLTEKDMSYRLAIDEALASRGLEVQPLIELGDTHLICELLRRGIGVSCLPEYVIKSDLEQGTLSCITVKDMELDMRRQLVYLKNKWLSREIRCVIKSITEK